MLANHKTDLVQHRLLDHLHLIDPRPRRPDPAPSDHLRDGLGRSLENRFYASIGTIANPARDATGDRLGTAAVAIPDVLYSTGDDHSSPLEVHGGEITRWGVSVSRRQRASRSSALCGVAGLSANIAQLRSLEMSTLTARSSGSRHRAIGLGASLLASFGWGFSAVFATLTSAPGLVLTFYRLWLGSLLLSVLVYSSGRRLSWATLRASLPGGIFLAGDMAMFFSAIKLTSVVDATVIGAVQPALVVIAARPLFGERMSRWDAAWILLAIAGVTSAVVGPGVKSHHQLVGDLLAVGALLAWSAYWLVTKRARARQNALEYTAGVTIVAAMALTVIVLVSGQSLARVEAGDWLWISLLAVVPGSAHLMMNWAHRYVDASVSSVIGSSNPIFAAGAAAIILGQRLTAIQIVGGLVGLAAIAVVATRHRHPAESPLE